MEKFRLVLLSCSFLALRLAYKLDNLSRQMPLMAMFYESRWTFQHFFLVLFLWRRRRQNYSKWRGNLTEFVECLRHPETIEGKGLTIIETETGIPSESFQQTLPSAWAVQVFLLLKMRAQNSMVEANVWRAFWLLLLIHIGRSWKREQTFTFP